VAQAQAFIERSTAPLDRRRRLVTDLLWYAITKYYGGDSILSECSMVIRKDEEIAD
jgi:hypothetical protein